METRAEGRAYDAPLAVAQFVAPYKSRVRPWAAIRRAVKNGRSPTAVQFVAPDESDDRPEGASIRPAQGSALGETVSVALRPAQRANRSPAARPG